MNRIVQFHELGGPEVLRLEDVAPTDPGPGEVRYRVESFALNRADLLFISGNHYSTAALPSRLGSEAAGVVDAIGEGVTQFQVGDKVSSIPFHNDSYGTQGEWAIVPEDYLCAWPQSLSVEQACSVWMQYLTAYFPLFEVGKLQASDYVLVTAASSSAGLGAIQLTENAGATAIATTRTSEKAGFLREAGARHVIATDEEDLSTRVMEITNGAGVRLVYDPIGGPFAKTYADALARHAIIFLYGMLAGSPTEVDVVAMVRKAAVIHPYSMFNHVCEKDQLERGRNYIQERLVDGSLVPLIDTVFPFEKTIDAYQRMESNKQTGKIVVKT